MDKKSKAISGLGSGKSIIQKANKYFTETEKHQIIEELLNSGCTKAEIWQKYTRQQEEHGQLLRWMRKPGYDTSIKTRRPNFPPCQVLSPDTRFVVSDKTKIILLQQIKPRTSLVVGITLPTIDLDRSGRPTKREKIINNL